MTEPTREFYILSLKWTRREDHLTWWGPECKGYTCILERAGRYPEADVRNRASYLDNGVTTAAIPCDLVERHADRVVLRDAADALLSAAFDRPTTLVGSTVDDLDHKGRDQCPCCEHGYGSPGPSRILYGILYGEKTE